MIQVLSYAFSKLRNTAVVVFLSLNHVFIAVPRRMRLSYVEQPFLKPVWNFGRSLFLSMYHFNLLFIILSRSLQRQDVNDIDLYESGELGVCLVSGWVSLLRFSTPGVCTRFLMRRLVVPAVCCGSFCSSFSTFRYESCLCSWLY